MSWKMLDLRSKVLMPKPTELVALRLVPKNEAAKFYREERYDIGRFKPDSYNPKSRKFWWHGTRGTNDPIRLRKHYDIWWCSINEYD